MSATDKPTQTTAQYIAIARPPRQWQNDYGDVQSSQPTITVYASENEPTDTGLVDAMGVRLFRVPADRVIGITGKGALIKCRNALATIKMAKEGK